MTFVLFHIKTGNKICECETEQDARNCMVKCNRDAGWEKLRISFVNGIETIWARATKGATDQYDTRSHAPYGFTEYDRWDKKFNPLTQYNRMVLDFDEVQYRYDV